MHYLFNGETFSTSLMRSESEGEAILLPRLTVKTGMEA